VLSCLGPTGRRIYEERQPIDPASLEPIPLDEAAISLLKKHGLEGKQFLTTAQLATIAPALRLNEACSEERIRGNWCREGRVPTSRPGSKPGKTSAAYRIDTWIIMYLKTMGVPPEGRFISNKVANPKKGEGARRRARGAGK
jgi:hypothetical protein